MNTASPGFFRPSPEPLAGRFVIDRIADTPRCSVGLGYDLAESRPLALYLPTRWSESVRWQVERWLRVSHPAVLSCFGWVEIEGRDVLAVDRLAADWGRPLALGERGERAAPTPAQAVGWTLDVVRGLLALAEAGLTHGQLSPWTVLILQGGRACLTLPGMAGCVLPDDRPARDIPAVGALLRFLLTGRSDGDDPLPADIAAIVGRCQADDPARGYAGLADLVADLSRLCPRQRTEDALGWLRAARGSVLTGLRRYEQAEAEFAAAGSTVAQAFVNRATQYLILERPDLAARASAEALRRDPDNAEAHACRGEALGQTAPVQGLAAFARAIELDPTAARAFAGRAVLRARSGDRAGAAEDLAQARHLAPQDPAIQVRAGEVEEQCGPAEEALRAYRAALGADPCNGRVRTRMARLLELAGKVSEAELEYTQALRDDPACAAAWLARGALRQGQGRNLDALADYTVALEIRPWDARPAEARAVLNRQLDRLDQAEADFTEALRRAPNALETRVQIGELLLGRARFRPALDHFEVVLAADASHAVALRHRAEALAGLEQAAHPATPVRADNPEDAGPAAAEGAAFLLAARAFFRGDYSGCCAHAFACLREDGQLAPALLVLQSLQRLGLADRGGPFERLEQTVTWALRRYENRPFETALIRLTLGEITASDALSQASSNVHVCQACYYGGIRAEFEADFDRSRRWLLESAATLADCPEREFAGVALGLCAADELGTPALAELLVPFVLTGNADRMSAVVAAFSGHDFEQTVELVERMDLVSAWRNDPEAVRFTPELARAAMNRADRTPGMVPLEMVLVLGRLAVISLGWLARPEDQARLAIRILSRAPDRPLDRYLLHLALRTAEFESPLCQLRGEQDVGLCHFYAAHARPPRAGDERALRERGALLNSTLERAPASSIERLLAGWELEGGPPPFTTLIMPKDMPPSYRIAGQEFGPLAVLMAETHCKEVARACGEQSLAYAIALNNLAHQHDEAGAYPQAAGCYREALATIRQTVPGSENEARCLSNLAMLYRRWGRHLDAAGMHRAALDLQRRMQPISPQDIGRTLNNLGVAVHQLGDPRGAESLLRQSLWLRRTHETQDLYAQTLHNLADALLDTARIGAARQLLLRAAEIRKRTLGPRHREIANLYTTLAMACQSLRQHEEAVTHAREALAIDDEAIGPEHPQYAVTLSCLATAYRGAGDLTAAEEYFRRAIETWRRSARGQTGFGTEQLLELTLLLERKGDSEGCWQALAELAEQESSDWLPALMSGDARQRLAVMARVFASLSYQLSILARTFPDRQPEQTYARVLRRKGMVGESIRLQREAVRASGDSALLGRLRTLSNLRGRLAGLSLARSDELTPEEWAGRFDWERQAEALERELTEAGAAASQQLASVSPADLVPLLGEATLVEYVRYLEVDGTTAIRGERYLAFVLDPGPPWSVRLVPLGDAAAIDGLIAEFRRGLAAGEPLGGAWMQAGRELRAAVFDPVVGLLGTRRRVVLALDGELNRVSFATLPTDKGGWLLDTFEFSHVSCGRDLVRSSSAPRELREAVVLAGPEFDVVAADAGEAAPAAGVLFAPLPHAAAEGDLAAELLRPYFATQVWTGRDAIKSRLTGLPRPPTLLHLATHGFFLEGSQAPGAEHLRRLAGGADPLTRGGIALAGAEGWQRGSRLPEEMGNGLLLAQEVAELDLTGTELVLLSACQSGLGQQHQGEGVFGLQRGFALAGARSLLMALWDVDDRAGYELVRQFYKELLRGESRSAALCSAQRWVCKRKRHPRFWGPFVLSGDAGPLPGFSRPSQVEYRIGAGVPTIARAPSGEAVDSSIGPTLFGFPSLEGRFGLPREVDWHPGGPADLTHPGAAGVLWVVHSAAVAEFRARRGERTVPAVVWRLQGGPEPPEDWWEDFSALLNEGNEEEARFLVRCARCPAALAAGEAVVDVASDWFLNLAGTPGEEDLARLPDWFQQNHAEALRQPAGRAEVLSRLGEQFAALRVHLFPSPQEIADWFAGVEVPAVARLAAVSLCFRTLLREQAEVWLDAGLSDLSKLTARLQSVGVESPRPAPCWRAAVRGWDSVVASLQGFAEALVQALVGSAVLRPALSGSRGMVTSASQRQPGSALAAERAAIEFLRANEFVELEAADSRTLSVTMSDDELTLRIPAPAATVPPRARLLRGGVEILSLPGRFEEEDSPGTEKAAAIVIRLEDLRGAAVPSATATAETIHLEIVF